MVKSKTLGLIFLLAATPAWADHSPNFDWPWKLDDSNPLSTLTINGLVLDTVQGYPTYKNNVDPNNPFNKGQVDNMVKSSFYLGMKLWKGASVYSNTEIYQGYNISNNIDFANNVNSTVPNVNTNNPYMQLQRLFFRQVIDIEGEDTIMPDFSGTRSDALASVEQKLADKVSENTLTFTFGKFAVGDIFDGNIYAHDPTRKFMNQSFSGFDSVDYVGNSWGTTVGAMFDWHYYNWSWRTGIFQGSLPPPSNNIDPVPLRQYMLISELERRYHLFDNPGSLKLIGYRDYGYLDQNGGYQGLNSLIDYVNGINRTELNDLMRRTVFGIGVNLQQQLADGIGYFMRAGMDNKSVSISDITHTFSNGLVFDGKLWNRPGDEIGAAFGIQHIKGNNIFNNNDLSFTPYGAGSAGYAAQKTIETYYKWTINDRLAITADYQRVINPNFNSQSHSAHVFGIRLRANF